MNVTITAMILALTAGGPGGPTTPADSALDRVHRALDLMGGEGRLRALERVRFDMMTQWQRTTFRDVPASDRPSFEAHTDVRDYTIPAWRNTRRFPGRDIVNIVRDSVATTDFGAGPQPLSVAYVDERDELFIYSPDRLVVHLADAADVRLAPDTVVAGEAYAVLHATLQDRHDASVLIHPGTGLPAAVRFRAAHPNDFGLSPWGAMDVQVWYSNWRSFGDVSIPAQWDVYRMGRPYKRLTVQRADFAADFVAADSFAVTPALRARFADEASAPMHDRPVDSTIVHAGGLVGLTGFGAPAGAIDTGSGWLLLGTGHMPLNLERARTALARHGAEAWAGGLAATTRAGDGGARTLAAEGLPVWAAQASVELVRRVFRNAGESEAALEVVDRRIVVGRGPRAIHLVPVDLPDAPGSVMLWAPALGWLYAPDAAQPLDLRLVEDRARALGWEWTVLGSARGFATRGAFRVDRGGAAPAR